MRTQSEVYVAGWLSQEYGYAVRVILIHPGNKQPEESGLAGWFTVGSDWLKKRAETSNELMNILVEDEL